MFIADLSILITLFLLQTKLSICISQQQNKTILTFKTTFFKFKSVFCTAMLYRTLQSFYQKQKLKSIGVA